MEIILDIIKTTVPALIVFLTVYFIIKQYFDNQYRLQLAELQRKNKEMTMPLRLGAYERMSVFLERLNLHKLVLRLRTESMTARDLNVAILVAVEHEWDHNVSQQVFVSSELWQILNMAKNEAMSLSNRVAGNQPEGASGMDFSLALFEHLDKEPQIALMNSQNAIRREVQVLF